MKITGSVLWDIIQKYHEEYSLIELEEFSHDGSDKYESRAVIFTDKDGCHWQAYQGRSGSHFTDWYYDPQDKETVDCHKVHQIEKVIKV